MEQSQCPQCHAENIYHDGTLWNCPDCGHEWSEWPMAMDPDDKIVKDAHGNELKDGDSVTVIKDLKVKGSSSSVKVGTKVKNIRIIDAEDGHNLSCKVDGFGALNLKSEFVKKA